MEFLVTIGAETQTFIDYHKMLAYITEMAGQWNNFEDDKTLQISINKQRDDANTLAINVQDVSKTVDRMA